MKKILLLLTPFAGTWLHAQTVLPRVLNTSGLSGTAGAVHFEFNLGETFTQTIGNGTILTLGALQPNGMVVQSPLPVTGLQLTARRIDGDRVQLDWKTLQEFSNRGFHVERKRENENAFAAVAFSATKAPGGNSTLPLHYQHIDHTAFRGKTWYRLRQEDLDGRTAYSSVALINGNLVAGLTAWPIPAPRDFQVRFSGNGNDQLLIYDGGGKLVRQVPIRPNEIVPINGLPSGTYLLRLRAHPDLQQRVVVQ